MQTSTLESTSKPASASHMDKVISKLIAGGYGKHLDTCSETLGCGIWLMEIGQGNISIFENGLVYKFLESVEINYSEVSGIKSALSIDMISRMQSEDIASLAMRFECGELNYDLIIPAAIYSALLGCFCDQIEQCQSRVVDTGFIKNKPTDWPR